MIWSLNLDQIEPGTGHIISKLRIPTKELGSSTHYFSPGTVLYSKLRPYLNKVVIADESGFATTELVSLRCDQNKITPEYLCHYLRSPKFVAFASATVAGAKMPRMVMGEFWNHKVPVPSIAEQRRISAVLDKAESLRKKRQEAIAELDRLAQAIFIEMFGDPVTNAKGLPLSKLGDIGTLERGISKHRPRNDPALLGGRYPLIQTGDVAQSEGQIRTYNQTYSEFGLKQSRLWPKGTLCITIAANIAKTGMLEFDACFPDSIVGFLARDPATVIYVRAWMGFLQKTIERNAPESAQKNINLEILRNLDVPYPSIEAQKEFANRIAKINSRQRLFEKAVSESELLFKSLQNKAFSPEF
jgi:type I restriction enzyme S subunit